jgi:hypothetical protein
MHERLQQPLKWTKERKSQQRVNKTRPYTWSYGDNGDIDLCKLLNQTSST